MGWSADAFDGVEADGEADVVGLFDDATHGLLRVTALVVVGAEVAVGLLVAEDVPDYTMMACSVATSALRALVLLASRR